ncbi:component of the polarisome [Nowakowskiella sp. JEL0407]|nr:component of the polarisome [Nowakowskiella sp. JEL0407]
MGVKELKDAIDKSVQLSVSEFGEKPVDWIRFQDKIAELISDKKTKFTYTIEEMMKIANKFRITDRRELEAVLRYFHNIGVVLYFPRNTQLRRVVFPDPQAVVNVISEVFQYHDTPPTIGDVSSHNLQALEELKANKVWMRSLLDELWGKHLDSRDVMALFDLLKEFDLLCDIKPLIPDSTNSNIAHNTLSIMPCLLPDEQIKAEDLVRPNTTIRETTNNLRISAREKLTRLTTGQFEELNTNLFDEIRRRQYSSHTVPFLPINPDYHPKRNRARQKLATLVVFRFKDFVFDMYLEIERRFPNFSNEQDAQKPASDSATAQNSRNSPNFPASSEANMTFDQMLMDLQGLVKDNPHLPSITPNLSQNELKSPVNELDRKAMRKALERGMLPVKRMKVVLVGQGRAGKTSLLRALRAKSFEKDEKSTVYVSPVEVDQHFLEDWKECKKIAQLLKSVQSSVNEETRKNQTLPNAAKEAPHTLSNIASPPTSALDDFAIDYLVDYSEKHVVSRSESKAIVKRLEDMHLATPKSDQYTTEADLNSTTLAIYDFAGQSRYSVFQQIFITAQAIYLVIFRLDAMFLDTNRLDQNELRVMLSWLNTIYLRAPQSKILIIGTQCDIPRSHNLTLLESYIPSTIKQAIVPNTNFSAGSNSIFITSAKTKFGVDELRDSIDKTVQLSVSELKQKPVDWIRFQDKLADLVLNKKTTLTYTIPEMMKIANEFRISDRQELEAVLRYFHTIGVVLYFPKNAYLRDIVFHDPQAVVNVVSTVFQYHDHPPAHHEVSRGNFKALEELRTNKVWIRSLLDELWGQHLDSNDQHRPQHHIDNAMSSFGRFNHLEDLVTPSKTVIDLILCFPDDVLPAGLYHQLAVRFAANSPRGYIPKVFQRCALVSLPQNELVIWEEFALGIVRIQLIVGLESIRSEFTNAWLYITAIVAGVISEHWSKRWVYHIVPACPSTRLPQRIPHGMKNIPTYGQRTPTHKVFCDHPSHRTTNEELDTTFLNRFWFSETITMNSPTTDEKSSTNSKGIEEGVGTIMISYSWGKKDILSGLYWNQEVVKRLATALESRGFKVWLDVRYMKGNMVEKMTKVITNSDAVISCVTNEYHVETSNAYREFMYAWYKKKEIFGVKMARDVDMGAGAYGFYKGFGDKFYALADCGSEEEYDLVIDELVRDISFSLES